MIIMETIWHGTKVCHSMNYYITYVYLGSYMLVCMYMQYLNVGDLFSNAMN
jgi:hypothetical protein